MNASEMFDNVTDGIEMAIESTFGGLRGDVKDFVLVMGVVYGIVAVITIVFEVI